MRARTVVVVGLCIAIVLLFSAWLTDDDEANTAATQRRSRNQAAPVVVSRGISATNESHDEKTATAPPDSFLVVDENGRPIPTAKIVLDDKKGTFVANSDGRTEQPLPRGVGATVSALGFATAFTITGFATRIVLEREQHIAGVVVDELGKPLAGCALELSVSFVPLGRPQAPNRDLKTDENGRFTCDRLPYARIYLTVQRDDVSGDASALSGDKNIRIVARHAVYASGTVVAADGTVASGAQICSEEGFLPSRYGGSYGEIGPANKLGRFRVRLPQHKTLRIFAIHEGARSAAVAITPEPQQDVTGVVLRIDDGAIVSSHLRVKVVGEDGAPLDWILVRWRLPAWRPVGARLGRGGNVILPHAPLSLDAMFITNSFGMPETTGEDGIQPLRLAVPPGTTVIVRAESAYSFAAKRAPAEMSIQTLAEPDHAPVVIKMRGLIVRKVRMRFANGKSATSLAELKGPAFETNDPEPGVVAWRLDPTGAFSLQTSDGRVLDATWNVPAEGVVREYTIPNPVQEHLQAPERGRVVTEDGAPVAGAVIESLLGQGSVRTTISARDGTFTTQRRVASPIKVSALGMGIATARDLTKPIVLRRAGHLRLAVHPPGVWRPEDWRIDVTHGPSNVTRTYALDLETRTKFGLQIASSDLGSIHRTFAAAAAADPGASGTIEDLAPGRYTVRLWTDGFEQIRFVRVVAGQTIDMKFAPR